MTIPNTILNTSSSDDDKIKPETRFFSGDWTSLGQEFLSREIISEEQKFDLILTSETIYNTENQSKLVSIFKKFLKKDGEVLVAGKTFYFGVGGGMRQFEAVVKESGLCCDTVKTFDTGVKREILKISL